MTPYIVIEYIRQTKDKGLKSPNITEHKTETLFCVWCNPLEFISLARLVEQRSRTHCLPAAWWLDRATLARLVELSSRPSNLRSSSSFRHSKSSPSITSLIDPKQMPSYFLALTTSLSNVQAKEYATRWSDSPPSRWDLVLDSTVINLYLLFFV